MVEFGWNVLIPPAQSANEEADYPHNLSGLRIETTCTSSNDLTWRQLSTEAGVGSLLVLSRVWSFNWPDLCCKSWAEDKNMCFLLLLSLHAATPVKGKNSCAHFGKNQAFYWWNGCVEVKISLAYLETVNSCTTQQGSVDWKVSPQTHSQLFLSAVCQDHQWTGTICIDGLVPLEQTVGRGGWGGVQPDWVTMSACVMGIVLLNRTVHLPDEFDIFLLSNSKKKVN